MVTVRVGPEAPSITEPKLKLDGDTLISGAGRGHSIIIVPPFLIRTVVEVASAITWPVGDHGIAPHMAIPVSLQ